ncbi:MAG TPA: hypothetical protein VMA86_06600 [Acetobacteraceae bacterium]|nr:hypothetical protein [Acetobacteraceae bacterium]
MRHVNIKLDDDDWASFERLRAALNEGRLSPFTISTVLRLVIRAGVEAKEAVLGKAAEAPARPPEQPARQWEAQAARLARAAGAGPGAAKQLYARFERRCDREQLTLHQAADALRGIDPLLTPHDLSRWYYEGEAPADATAAARLLAAVAKWLENE